MPRLQRRVLLTIGALLVVAVAVGLTGLMVAVRSAPPPLTVPTARPSATLRSTPSPTLAGACPVPTRIQRSSTAGVWLVQPGSVAGYRAHERMADIPTPNVAVARTDHVAGWGAVERDAGGKAVLTEGCFAVDLRGLHSQDQIPGFNMRDRDSNVQGFLNTSLHPFGVLTIDAAQLGPSSASKATATIPGQLEVNGIELPATFTVQLQRNGSHIGVAGSAVVNVDDYHVEIPKDLNFIDVDPHITVEFAAVLAES